MNCSSSTSVFRLKIDLFVIALTAYNTAHTASGFLPSAHICQIIVVIK